MSITLTIKPFEQIIVEGATLAGISINAKDAATKYARAQAALKVAAVATALSTGDLSQVAAATQALTATTDVGVVKFTSDLINIIQPLVAAAETGAPLVAAGAQVIAKNIAAGITAVASTYPAPAQTVTGSATVS